MAMFKFATTVRSVSLPVCNPSICHFSPWNSHEIPKRINQDTERWLGSTVLGYEKRWARWALMVFLESWRMVYIESVIHECTPLYILAILYIYYPIIYVHHNQSSYLYILNTYYPCIHVSMYPLSITMYNMLQFSHYTIYVIMDCM
jgi:hypothetical protein